MDDSRVRLLQLIVSHFQRHCLVAATARRDHASIIPEHRWNAQSLLNTIAPPHARSHLYRERRRNGRKGFGHQHLPILLQNQCLPCCQPLICSLDLRM